jgi:adenine phosphoribosyltransferase
MVDYKKYIEEHKDFPIEGINYLDLNPIYKNEKLRTELVDDCIKMVWKILDIGNNLNFDYIGVVESRGFLIGSIIAHELDKGIVLLRSKKNRLPGETIAVKHKLEYGESIVEVQKGTGKVLIFDDVLATGGTAQGSIDCLEQAGYSPAGVLFLVELDFLNAKLTTPHKSVIHYE